MRDSPVKPKEGSIDRREPEELLIDAIDVQALQEARERQAARFRLLWRNRRFLVAVTICGLVFSMLTAFLIPKRYESTAELMPPNQSSGSGAALMAALSGGKGVLGTMGGGLTSMAESVLGIQTTGALFVGILESQTVQDDLIHKFDLEKVYKTADLAGARKVLAGHTDISVNAKSGIISITVVDHDPRRAAAMAQEYVNELNWVVTHLSTSSAYRERVFLDQRLKKVKANLETAENKFSQFASQKGAIDVPEQGKAMVTAAATLQGQLVAAEAELQAFRQIYTNNNVRVRSLQARVNELHASLEKLAGKGANEKSSAQQLYPSLRELPLLGVKYADLLRRLKVDEAVFAVLTQEDELARLQEAKDTPSVRVLDPPLVPQKKSFPPRLIIMILGTMLAFVFGTAWILGSSGWKAVDPRDPRKVVALEVWGDVHAMMPWNSQNGLRNGGPRHWLRNRFRRKQGIDSGS